MADDTGAGKTIMAGLLIKELMMRGLAERILIITPGGLTKQWQEDELGIKFNIPFTLVNRGLFSSDPNVFHTSPRIVTSIDFISREDVLNVASNSNWDLIVIDECHKLSAYDYGTKQNPNLWSQRHKIEAAFNQIQDIDDFDELEDSERDALENIMSDPKKFRLFTTANSLQELQQEATEVKRLFEMAQSLYNRNQAEKKFLQLQELLTSQKVIDGQKLVIFTEHKDTLLYLEDRLSNDGYTVVTIHGGKLDDDRREAQWAFAKPETQILIATDAAGEGINLQFCRLLINWDIPWNPNRLEQRMGRIHRYGQKQDVLVFNMVASNTKEGKVLERLLTKLDIIREGIGDDRVYDVIQDVLENISLEAIINSVFNGKETSLNEFLAQDNETLKIRFTQKIKEQKENLAHSRVDYKDARILKENSDEKRLQPIYIRLFFEKAFKLLGGEYTELRESIYRIDRLPDLMIQTLRNDYNIYADAIRQIQFCFDKQIFLDYQSVGDLGKVHYINPGNPVFDSLVKVVRNQFREDMLKGTVLISPDDNEDFFAFFVKSQIVDNRLSKKDDSIADERLLMVCQNKDGNFSLTSPAKFIDLHAPAVFTKPIVPPAIVSQDEVVQWSFENITIKQFEDTKIHVKNDSDARINYLESAFTQVILDLQVSIQELQTKVLLGDLRVQEKIIKKQDRISELILKKQSRLQNMELMSQLNPKAPEVLGCAYVIPLTQVEYQGHYGMSRDDEAETIAMATAMNFEKSIGWSPVDVSSNNEGYDIRSISPEELKRYIEVKGRSGDDGSVMLSENEMNRLAQLGDAAWLYIVINCKSKPELHRIQNPAKALQFELKTKGIQYLLPMNEWKTKSIF